MKEIKFENLKFNPSTMIGNDWMLISAGNRKSFNMMTASWGNVGALWGHHLNGRATATIFVRPSRYTDKFVNKHECFVLSFFDKKYKKDLSYLGSHSGRDGNKLVKTSIHVEFKNNLPCFKEAKLTLICKKIYKGKINKAGFIEKKIINEFYKGADKYNNNSYHNVYIGEIIKAFVKH